MKLIINIISIILICLTFFSCNKESDILDKRIIFLHHSTGDIIWHGKNPSRLTNMAKRINREFAEKIRKKPVLLKYFDRYNRENNKTYLIEDKIFPKASPYGWNNYPYDYYNIWVKNAGKQPYMEEPTLEILTKDYDVIIFKHCFPSSNIKPNKDTANINSNLKTLSNYKLQYRAIKEKLSEFPDTKFIVFTGAVQVKSKISEEEAERAKEFNNWVIKEWDSSSDNIYLWDLYRLQTEGGIYFKDEYAKTLNDSHPNDKFAKKAAKLFFDRIIDIIENEGEGTLLTGEEKYE